MRGAGCAPRCLGAAGQQSGPMCIGLCACWEAGCSRQQAAWPAARPACSHTDHPPACLSGHTKHLSPLTLPCRLPGLLPDLPVLTVHGRLPGRHVCSRVSSHAAGQPAADLQASAGRGRGGPGCSGCQRLRAAHRCGPHMEVQQQGGGGAQGVAGLVQAEPPAVAALLEGELCAVCCVLVCLLPCCGDGPSRA